ncbi:MAG: hypothetical protein HGA80_08200 [Candidatus Omnitrophica bacterium]|nr:hypothetical protein [Candidatus Omnitrophota bacterium]
MFSGIRMSINEQDSQTAKGELSRRLIVIYTVLLVLRHMRDRLGIEAMVQFLDSYTRTIERIEPDVKKAVNEELMERALQDLHETVCGYEK